MSHRPSRLPLPRYVRRKWLRGEKAWAYFFDVPTWARRNGCTVQNEPLGSDYGIACQRAEEILLRAFDSWRTGGGSDIVPERGRTGTFDWLAQRYKTSTKYTDLSRSQQANHDLGLRMVADHVRLSGRRFGESSLQEITTAVADRLFEKLLVVDGRERRTTVNHAMKSCRRAWNVVARAEPKIVPPANPFSKMGLVDASKETPTATYAELLKFVAAADAAGRASLGTAAMVSWEWLQREEHVFGQLIVEHYRPKGRPDEVRVVHPKTGEEVWIPLVGEGGARLFPELMDRLDAIKATRIAGLMIVRDWTDRAAGRPIPWVTEKGGLDTMRHEAKAIVNDAELRPELSFTSFRHGGMTELGDADLTDAQIRAISRHKSSKTLPRYVKKTQRQIVDGTVKRRAVRTNAGRLSE